MLRKRLAFALVAGFVLLLPRFASADNLTFGTAYSIKPGGTPAEGHFGGSARYYRFIAVAGRSYCADTQGGVYFDTSADFGVDTALTVFRADQTTIIGSVDDDSQEPFAYRLSRVCWISAVTEDAFVKVWMTVPTAATESMNFRLKVTETTLFSNWFYTGGDYSAYTIIRNTTNTGVNYTVNWRNPAGAVVATQSGTLAGNGSTFVDARSKAGALGAGSGTVEIVHDSSAGAIMATSTVLSASTGLSFDTFFIARPSW